MSDFRTILIYLSSYLFTYVWIDFILLLSLCNGFTGAGEDVEAVMERLRAQATDNVALRERQAQLEKDQQVTPQPAHQRFWQHLCTGRFTAHFVMASVTSCI